MSPSPITVARLTVPGALALLALAAGCQAVDRAGGAAAETQTVLSFANPNGDVPDQLQAWADEVEKQSDGTLQIDFRNEYRNGEVDYETGTIHDVASGEVDMAWVGARAFDRAGSTAFQALLAPMLIDSHDLQAAVFEAGIPLEMGRQVTGLGVHVVGVFPGPMRKVLGIDKPFVSPADFDGTVVGLQDSALADEALRALGATPRPVPTGAPLDGLDAYEQQLASVYGNHYWESARYVTGNLDLWPRPLVVIAGESLYDGLDRAQRTALETASRDVVPGALEASRAEDEQYVADLCSEGLQVVSVPEQGLTAFQAAWAPIYDQLRAAHDTGDALRRIEELKAQVAAEPDAATCDGVHPAPQAATNIDGTYEVRYVWAETPPAGCPVAEPGETWAEFQLTLRDGRAVGVVSTSTAPTPEVGFDAPFRVFRDRIEFGGSQDLSARFELDGDILTFSDMQGPCAEVTIWTTLPWQRTDNG
jgi:TRAP-type C4-dicarboxylate transport system substrate-binding protein